jgi:hypothetical protein
MSGDFSPAASWEVIWPCDVSTESPTVTGLAVTFASEVLWSLTGQRFGFTTVKLRPCRDYAWETPFPDGWLPWPGAQPPPLGATGGGFVGYWFGVGCGTCVGGCSCTSISEVKLPAPVHAITEVRVDGSPLVTGAYRLDNGRLLVRTDGSTWPVSNNLALADTQVGTWSVTAMYGESVPTGAAIAVGELACEYIRGVSGQDCRLPRAVTQLARQGVTITLPDMSTMFDKGLTGLFFVDTFIKTWNPKNLRARARTYSIDSRPRGRVGP